MIIKKDKRRLTKKIYQPSVVQIAIINSIYQLNPLKMIKNPIMFVIEICLIIMIALTIKPNLFTPSVLSWETNLAVSILLLLILFFSNFAETIIKQFTKAEAESLEILHGDIEVKRVLPNKTIEYIFASQLEKGNIIKIQKGDLIPLNGEVIEGVASVDESAITGESAPVLKEPGTDISSSVTAGSRVLTDWLFIKITSEQGQTYSDQMINIAEMVEKYKTPNEIRLNSLLIAATIVLLLVTLLFIGIKDFLNIKFEITLLIAFLVCLIPITIASLMTPIKIAGFHKLNKLNVIATSEKSIETAADINVLFIDKTGTITFGNRMATEFIPLGSNSLSEVARVAYLASYYDQTPEGKSIVLLAKRHGVDIDINNVKGLPHEFTAHTRMSGIDLENGEILRKGASDAIKKFVLSKNGIAYPNVDQVVENIAIQGGTPLLISRNNEIIGTIHLKDIVKISMKNKFQEMSALGIKTIMCTGDNELTAKVIAKEIGIDEYIAQAKPEDKIHLIRDYQAKGIVVAMIGDGTNDAPALAQADIGIAMNNGTVAAKEAANMIDIDSDPTKIFDIIKTGKQLLVTREALTIFTIFTSIAKCFVMLPFLLASYNLAIPNLMHLESTLSATLSTLIFTTITIPLMIPISLKGVAVNQNSKMLLITNLINFGLLGLTTPLVGIKLIDLLIGRFI